MLVIKKCLNMQKFYDLNGKERMKKYLLLIEDEKMWLKFKDSIKNDINSEIIDLIRKKIEGKEVKK